MHANLRHGRGLYSFHRARWFKGGYEMTIVQIAKMAARKQTLIAKRTIEACERAAERKGPATVKALHIALEKMSDG